MGRPHVIWVGYHNNLEPAVILPETAPKTDDDGAGEYDPFALAEYLNAGADAQVSLVLPWMGGYRLRRDWDGWWTVEKRSGGGRDYSGAPWIAG